jgi:hypothetical protein
MHSYIMYSEHAHVNVHVHIIIIILCVYVHNSYSALIGVHEMHGRMHPTYTIMSNVSGLNDQSENWEAIYTQKSSGFIFYY